MPYTNYEIWCKKPYIDNIPLRIAQKHMRVVLGAGLQLTSEDEKINDTLASFYEREEVFYKLKKCILQLSLNGRSIILLERMSDGEFSFNVIVPAMLGRVSKVNEREQSADIWAYRMQADNGGMIHIVCNRKYMLVETYDNDQIIVGESTQSIPVDVKPVKIEKFRHGLTRLPLIELINEPFNQIYGMSTVMNGQPDIYAVQPLINEMQYLYEIMHKELTVNRSRIFGVRDPSQTNIYGNNRGLQELLEADAWIATNAADLDMNGATGVQVMQGNYDPKGHIEYLFVLEERIFNGVGMDAPHSRDEGNTYENKTKSMMSTKHDMQFKEFKRAYLRQKLYIIFDYLLIDKGLYNPETYKERPYTIDFIDATIVDILTLDSLINSRLANGTESISGAIAKYDKLNPLQAKEKMQKINKEFKENVEIIQQRQGNIKDKPEKKEGNKNGE